MPLTGQISQLDHLYWNTDLRVAEIAERLGLPSPQLSLYTTPQPAGVQCYLCHADLAFTSRAQRNGQRLRCRTCGCSRRHPDADLRHAARERIEQWQVLPANGSVILVRQCHHNLGLAIESCLDALARAGRGWDQRSIALLTDADRNPDAVVSALEEFDAGVLAVTSLCDLGATQTERLQTLFRVTNQGWWVVAANDVQMQHRITSYDLELRHDEGIDSEWPEDYALKGDPERPFAERLINATASYLNRRVAG